MIRETFAIKNGLYLVIDPSMALPILLSKVEAALKGGVDIIQIWNYFNEGTDKEMIVKSIVGIARPYQVPVLINEDITFIHLVDGIHFDEIPADFDKIKSSINPNAIIGITCGNDFKKIEWAVENNLDYISFCSVFPSKSVDTCELVRMETIKKARAFTKIPMFLSGGINLTNLYLLKETGMDGIALISGIMGAEEPAVAAYAYKQALINLNKKQKQLI